MNWTDGPVQGSTERRCEPDQTGPRQHVAVQAALEAILVEKKALVAIDVCLNSQTENSELVRRFKDQLKEHWKFGIEVKRSGVVRVSSGCLSGG